MKTAVVAGKHPRGSRGPQTNGRVPTTPSLSGKRKLLGLGCVTGIKRFNSWKADLSQWKQTNKKPKENKAAWITARCLTEVEEG